MEIKVKQLVVGAFGIGLAGTAAYLEVNGGDAGYLWIGVFICFISVID